MLATAAILPSNRLMFGDEVDLTSRPGREDSADFRGVAGSGGGGGAVVVARVREEGPVREAKAVAALLQERTGRKL